MKTRIAFALLMLPLVAYTHPGWGIVENKKGEIYYTDLKQVWKIALDGRMTVVVPNVHTHELYLDPNDHLFGEHLWYNGDAKNTWGHYVWKLSTDGKVSKVIPDSEGFLKDYSFIRDHLGRMYWTEGDAKSCQKVVRRNEDNSKTTLQTPCFHNIRNLEALRDGGIGVVDFQDIRKISPDGNVTTVASRIANKNSTTSTTSNQNSVMAIWDDAQGNLYAAVSSERMVKRFRLDGKEEIAFETSFPWSVSGGLVDSRGRLWVLEYNTLNDVRVERRDPNGTQTVFKP